MKTKRKAFSFIELIVVVTIIAILSIVGMVSYAGVSKKSRDSRRIADLEKMRIALEMARQIGTTYPNANSGVPIGLTPTYLDAIPKDPKTGNNYLYTKLNNYAYTIGASMEDLGSTNISPIGSNNYQVKSP